MWRILSMGGVLVSTVVAADPRLEFAWGVLAESRGDAETAAAHFDKALAADPTASALVKRKVERLISEGKRAAAVSLYDGYAKARKDDLEAQLGYADFLAEQGKGDSIANKRAIETLDAALPMHPGHPEIIRRLFSLDRSRGEELLDQLLADEPESVLLFAKLIRNLHDADDEAARQRVDERLQGAMDSHPADPVLAREASEHFRNSGRRAVAIEVLRKHVSAAPWSLDLKARLGVLCFAEKMDEEGERALKELLAIHPRHAMAHQAIAKFYRLRGRTAEATHHAAELLKIRGGSTAEFIKLADEYLAADRAREARLLLEKGAYHHAEDLPLRMKLAIATQKDPETRSRAPRLFREVEAVAGGEKITDPVFLTTSADVFIDAGQSKAGEERLRAAIRAYPPEAKKETAAALRRLASLWRAENRNVEAARALSARADALDPR